MARRFATVAKPPLLAPMPDPAPPPTSTRALLGERDYVLFWCSRWLGTLGSQIQGVTMGWQIYAVSRRTLSVGASALNVSLIGLVTFVPLLLLALPAGGNGGSARSAPCTDDMLRR